MKPIKYVFLILFAFSCRNGSNNVTPGNDDTVARYTTNPVLKADSQQVSIASTKQMENKNLDILFVSRHELVEFAKTLIGVPYKYASIDPSKGFDCSGFITYVFNHFEIQVPRSSVDFTNVPKAVEQKDAKEGDLILFTGTIDSIRIVGHMGIVTENSDTLKFIHSTSGKANGVTISKLDDYYKKRFMKVIDLFQNDVIVRGAKF